MWEGMSRTTGKRLGGIEHLRQSVRDILTTPRRTRVMARGYGSGLGSIIDRPLGRETIVLMMADAAEALERDEPRFRLRRFVVEDAGAGHLTIGGLEGVFYPDWPAAEGGREVEVTL